MAEPTPASSTGTEAMIVSVTVGIAMPNPSPKIAIPTIGIQKAVSTSSRAKNPIPTMMISPAMMTVNFGPSEGTDLAETPVPSIIVPATGVRAAPAMNAVRPCTSW